MTARETLIALLKLAVAAVLLGILLAIIDLGVLVGSILRADRRLLALVVALTVVGMAVRALRLGLILRQFGARPPYPVVHAATYVGFFFASVSPAKVGDLYRPIYLRHNGDVDTTTGTYGVVLARALDLGSLVLYAAGTYAWVSLAAPDNPVTGRVGELVAPGSAGWALAVGGLAVASAVAAYAIRRRGALLDRFVPGSVAGVDTRTLGANLRRSARRPGCLSAYLALSLLIWSVQFVQAHLLLVALGASVPITYVFVLLPVATVAAQLPLTPSGIGTREAATVVLFGIVGVGVEAAVALSILLQAFTLWAPAAAGGLWYGSAGLRS